jgi:hypothetical protein
MKNISRGVNRAVRLRSRLILSEVEGLLTLREKIVIPILLILSQHLYCQDSLLAKSIDAITRKKYDLQNKTYWLLTKEKIVPEA